MGNDASAQQDAPVTLARTPCATKKYAQLPYQHKHKEWLQFQRSHFSHFAKKFASIPQSEVYKLPALSAKICACFLDEVKNIAKQYPNVQLNYQGMILNQFGFDCYFEHLASYLSPLLVQLYPALTSNTPFEMQYVSAIVVHYNANVTPEREGHFEHVDDSDLTLNMVLNPESSFSGGELYIRVLGTVNMGKETGYTCVPHEFGSGILHQGKAAHSSASMRNGSRYNLVVWFKAVPLSYYDKVVPFAIEIHYDVRTLVANFLDVATLYHFMQTSKQNMQIANDSKIWFQIYSQKRNARIKSPIVYDATTNWKSKLKEKDYEPELEYLSPVDRKAANLALTPIFK